MISYSLPLTVIDSDDIEVYRNSFSLPTEKGNFINIEFEPLSIKYYICKGYDYDHIFEDEESFIGYEISEKTLRLSTGFHIVDINFEDDFDYIEKNNEEIDRLQFSNTLPTYIIGTRTTNDMWI